MQMLEAILTIREIDDEAAAEAVGVSRSQLSKLRRGKSRPSLDVAVRIERLYGVPCAAWAAIEAESANEATADLGTPVNGSGNIATIEGLSDDVMASSSSETRANDTRITADVSGGAK